MEGERFGPYQLLRRLGSGGTAEVWRARRDGRACEVALKRLHRQLADDARIVDLFVAEGLLVQRQLAPHPHLVAVHDVGEIDGRAYLEMELIAGPSLDAVVAETTSIAIEASAQILLDVCAALAHVRERASDLVHADVCPGNVLLGPDGVARLSDFGVAVREGQGGVVRGTAAYMSPEQVRGEPLDHRSDVFSVGVIAWELLAGRRLFHRGPSYLTQAAVVEAPAPTLAAAPALASAVADALSKDRARRIASCAALRGRFEEAFALAGVHSSRAAVAALTHASTPRPGAQEIS